nr:MAG TPA: Photosystem II reaction centre I protein (PSII 4.8 kDa protein) [Caudoviricetes sp.]
MYFYIYFFEINFLSTDKCRNPLLRFRFSYGSSLKIYENFVSKKVY